MVSTVQDFNRQKKLDVDSVSGTPTVDKATPIIVKGASTESIDEEHITDSSDSLSYALPQETDLFDIKPNVSGYIDGVYVFSYQTADIFVEILDSNDNVIATSSITTINADNFEWVSLSQSDYSRELSDEQISVRIDNDSEDLVQTELYTYSYDGDGIEITNSEQATGYRFNGTRTLSESKTGNGDIVIDFTNISDAQDIAVYDQNDNLLDYEIEDLDTTSETAVLWCYNSWVRDGSTQAKVVYGDNSDNTDNSNTTGTWSNDGADIAYHLENSSDSTGNSTATVTGATTTDNGQIDGAYDFDGTDDNIETDHTTDYSATGFTIIAWFNSDNVSDTAGRLVNQDTTGSNDLWRILNDDSNSDGTDEVNFDLFGASSPRLSSTSINSGEWYLVIGYYNGSNNDGSAELFLDDTSQATATETSPTSANQNLTIGAAAGTNEQNFDGRVDEVRMYTGVETGNSTKSDWVQAEYDASPKAGQVFFSQQAAEDTTTVQTISAPTSTVNSVTPNPQVNAGAVTVSSPVSTVNANSVNPSVFTDLTLSAPVSTVQAGTPAPAVTGGATTANAPTSTVNAVTPNPTITLGETIRAPESTVTATTPNPAVKGGLEEIVAPVSTVNAVNPEPKIFTDKTINARVSTIQAVTQDPTLQAGPTTVTMPETTVQAVTPNPDVVTIVDINVVQPTQALITNPTKYALMDSHTFKQNDVGDKVSATLEDDNGAIDLTGIDDVTLVIEDTDGNQVMDKSVNVTDSANGEVEYEWVSGDPIETIGVYRAEFKIIDGAGDTETVPNNGYVSLKVEDELG